MGMILTCGKCSRPLDFFGPVTVRCANAACTEYTDKEVKK